MKWIFWACVAFVAYAYVGYAAWLWVWVRLCPRPIRQQNITPLVSIIIAARNEAKNLPAKLENLRRLRYPAGYIQTIIASDGSTDDTAQILRQATPAVVPVILNQSNGKAHALNEAVKQAKGKILVFLDARQSVEEDAITQLVACFADPDVGAVSGELLLETDANGAHGGVGIYWKIEKVVRKLESASGSVVGVTGAIYAISRELYTPMPTGTILDDVFIPMHVARKGKRVIFQPMAIARDRIFGEKKKEFSRKVRTLTGNYQLFRLAPWLLTSNNPLLFRLVSHKLMRLFVPFFLLLMLVASATASGSFYTTMFMLQLLFYAAALAGFIRPSAKRFKTVSIAYTFVMLNTAAAVAFYNFAVNREKVWV